jgi:hypothetical protein
MGILKLKEEVLDQKTLIIKEVLEYFSIKEDSFTDSVIQGIAAAADNAFSDEILFEEFENWSTDKDDESFLYLINHYWESRTKPVLSESEMNLTGKNAEIKKIKEMAKLDTARKFGRFLNCLALDRSLKSQKEIGDFLGVSSERARVLLDGKHKPQRATVIKVSEKFGVPIQDILIAIE